MSTPKQETLNSNDQKAYDNLDEDSKKIIDRLDNLVDKISEPLRNALDQAKNRPTGCLYDEGQLQEINDKVLKQLDELEGAIKDKF